MEIIQIGRENPAPKNLGVQEESIGGVPKQLTEKLKEELSPKLKTAVFTNIFNLRNTVRPGDKPLSQEEAEKAMLKIGFKKLNGIKSPGSHFAIRTESGEQYVNIDNASSGEAKIGLRTTVANMTSFITYTCEVQGNNIKETVTNNLYRDGKVLRPALEKTYYRLQLKPDPSKPDTPCESILAEIKERLQKLEEEEKLLTLLSQYNARVEIIGPFELEGQLSDKEIIKKLGQYLDFDSADTLSTGKQAIEDYSGTCVFDDNDDDARSICGDIEDNIIPIFKRANLKELYFIVTFCADKSRPSISNPKSKVLIGVDSKNKAIGFSVTALDPPGYD